MNTKTLVPWLLLLFGETLIVTSFILLGSNLECEILTLNIIVVSMIYGLFFVDILVPWIDLADKSQRKVGSIGVRWLTTWLYAITAIAVMIVANLVFDVKFAIQLILHGVLLFSLSLGLFGASYVSAKVDQVGQTEMASHSGITEMKKVMLDVKNKMNEMTNIPDNLFRRINALEENLRFISPSDDREAHKLERAFIETLNEIKFAVSDYSINEKQIERNLNKLESIYQNRKNSYS
jgi:hypothetical protein